MVVFSKFCHDNHCHVVASGRTDFFSDHPTDRFSCDACGVQAPLDGDHFCVYLGGMGEGFDACV